MEKDDFSARLNQALDEAPLKPPVPKKGRGRQRHVARLFNVDQKAARKWLEAEGYPKLETVIVIAKTLQVTVEWLLTGRGPKRVMEDNNNHIAALIDMWLKMRPDAQEQWLRYGEFLLQQPTPQIPSQPEYHKKLQ